MLLTPQRHEFSIPPPTTNLVLEVGNEHAKLRAPVTDVVDTKNIVADEFQDASNRIANNRRAQVAHVHLCDGGSNFGRRGRIRTKGSNNIMMKGKPK